MFEFNATFIVAILSFTVFIMIMNTIFYRPILSIIMKRENYINSNYEDSKRFEADANEYKTTHAAKIEQIQEKCRHEFKKTVEKTQNKATDKVKMAKENSKFEILQKKETEEFASYSGNHIQIPTHNIEDLKYSLMIPKFNENGMIKKGVMI